MTGRYKLGTRQLLDRKRLKTRADLSIAVIDRIEVIYNRTRRHSSLGMPSPAAYEKLHTLNPTAA